MTASCAVLFWEAFGCGVPLRLQRRWCWSGVPPVVAALVLEHNPPVVIG